MRDLSERPSGRKSKGLLSLTYGYDDTDGLGVGAWLYSALGDVSYSCTAVGIPIHVMIRVFSIFRFGGSSLARLDARWSGACQLLAYVCG